MISVILAFTALETGILVYTVYRLWRNENHLRRITGLLIMNGINLAEPSGKDVRTAIRFWPELAVLRNIGSR